MILRAFRKQKVVQPDHKDSDTIAHLAAFALLPEQTQQTIADHSRKISVKMGMAIPEATKDHCSFLVEGELSLVRQDGYRLPLKQSDPASGYPLPPAQQWQRMAKTDLVLLEVPDRYLELARDYRFSPDSTQSGNMGRPENEATAQLCRQFHKGLKSEQYELPVLPDLALRISDVIDDPDTDNDAIARVIQLDPSISAHMMKVVNSAAFGGVSPIGSLQHAVARLGRIQVRNLVYTCIVREMFQTDSRILKASMQKLWRHSCRVAAISSVLARYTPGLDPDRALLAGLVHDIGAIPLLQTAAANPELLKSVELLDEVISEMKAGVGRITLQLWHFDEEMCQLAYHAEDWFRLGSAVADYIDVVLVAQLHTFVGQGAGANNPRIDQIPAFQKLALGKLTPRHSIGILDKAAQEIDEVEKLLH